MKGWLTTLWYGNPDTTNVPVKKEKKERVEVRNQYQVQASVNERVKAYRTKAGYQEHLAKKAKKEAQECMCQKKPDKAKASRLLKKSKMHERNAMMMHKQADNLEQTSMVLDSAAINADMAHVLQDGLATGQQMMQEINVDDVVDNG